MVVIHWQIDGREGHGENPVSLDYAASAVSYLNSKFGSDTHWVVPA